MIRFLIVLIVSLIFWSCAPAQKKVRFATYNVSFYRDEPGQLKAELLAGGNERIRNVAAIIQHIRPDVLLLNEFDYDPTGETLDAFCEKVLRESQWGQDTIDYPYRFQVPSNTGLLAPIDMDGDGQRKLPEDGLGFGRYEGQYAFAILSKYPLITNEIRTFQEFKWKDMPNAMMVLKDDGTPFLSDSVMSHFRLSSKNHIDLPVRISSVDTIHLLAAHPTPPTFDGPEDLNGKRNYDEIRLIVDYISGKNYLEDDAGNIGGLGPEEPFVVLGDLNADPIDGNSIPGAILQLLRHPRIHQAVSIGDMVPASTGAAQNNRRVNDQGDPKFDTSFFGLRVDYALPSDNLKVTGTGMFWPGKNEKGSKWISNRASSDHALVWVDVQP